MKPALLALLLLGACAAPQPVSRSPGDASRAAVNDACRVEAERVVNYRDRGQTMRQDDYNARIGTTSYLGPQVITDQIAQVYDRDRMAADCVRGANRPSSAPIAAPAASPLAAEPAATPRARARR